MDVTDLLADHSALHVDDADDDDLVLVTTDGTRIDTWREGYPYDERLTREEYDASSGSCRPYCSSCRAG